MGRINIIKTPSLHSHSGIHPGRPAPSTYYRSAQFLQRAQQPQKKKAIVTKTANEPHMQMQRLQKKEAKTATTGYQRVFHPNSKTKLNS
jgi:hypothetical protein